jgi:hypothetical protein
VLNLKQNLTRYRARVADEESIKNLETASYFCDKNISEELYHNPFINEIDVYKFLTEKKLELTSQIFWLDVRSFQYRSYHYNERGFCGTFNPINAYKIFRNDTVDPEFLKLYQVENTDIDPHFWDVESGYEPNKIKYYPLRTLDGGTENGLTVYFNIFNDTIANIDPLCWKDPQVTTIALHHPADAISDSQNFVSVPFNKSLTVFVKPIITRTSEELKSYDPSV